MSRNRIVVNGMTVEVDGNNVAIRNGTVYVDGLPVHSGLSGVVDIIWHGDLANLEADGSVTCQDVYGDVAAGNSVKCRSVPGRHGSRQAGGSYGINGNITAGNSVRFGS
jgi:hypothetical protein